MMRSERSPLDLHSSRASADGRAVTKNGPVYDRNLTEWSARHRKNEQSLRNMNAECARLKQDVAREQQAVDTDEEALLELERKLQQVYYVRAEESKSLLAAKLEQKTMLQNQLSESRKLRRQLQKQKDQLTADFDRKYTELHRLAEQKQRLELQLAHLSKHLHKVSSERKGMEKELGNVESDIQNASEVVDEIRSGMQSLRSGVREGMEFQEAHSVTQIDRLDVEQGSVMSR
jgi:chromosome segregation ATPase